MGNHALSSLSPLHYSDSHSTSSLFKFKLLDFLLKVYPFVLYKILLILISKILSHVLNILVINPIITKIYDIFSRTYMYGVEREERSPPSSTTSTVASKSRQEATCSHISLSLSSSCFPAPSSSCLYSPHQIRQAGKEIKYSISFGLDDGQIRAGS
jgi:hypothetical protein